MTTQPIDPQALKNAQTWLDGNYSEETKTAIREMLENNPTELTDSFYQNLEFGTGGLRGIMGVGTNRMNEYTVSMATQGLANYLLQAFPLNTNPKVAIAFDSRNNSQAFARITAEVFAGNGIKVFLFESLRPTPELSFAIRHLGCQGGVVVTASHNPKEYNGYKAYWNDGGQLVSPHDKNVIQEVLKISSVDDVKRAANSPLIEIIGENIDKVYIDKLKTLSLSPELIAKHKNLKIVYTPLHGTGTKLVPRALKEFGFTEIIPEEVQSVPDGNFPSIHSPNPEEKASLQMAIDKAKQTGADLVLATDPDADRVGVAVRNSENEFVLLNGNETASVLVYYVLRKWSENKKLTGKEFIVKTIVTTELLKEIADFYKVECFDVLTGFKFIADKILELEGKKQFIVGGEESYGYLIGDFVRDKDAVASCCMIAEAAAWAAEQKKTIYDILTEIYLQFGFFKENLLSITRKGKTGADEIKQMMVDFRNNPPQSLGNSKVICIKDYQKQISKDVLLNTETPINQPKSDVLQFFTEDGSKITVRPSGTEPKIKFYFGMKTQLTDKQEYKEKLAVLESKINSIIKEMQLQ